VIKPIRALLSALLLLAVMASGWPALVRIPTAQAATTPSGLPDHLGIGLAAHPDSSGLSGWMPASGIPWDYAYQYLSGGVNTGTGWETWNANGQFPLWYAQDAASHHYIPVFTYYDLLQSNGTCASCGEGQHDLSNLNNSGTMNSYYQNFALLMQRLGKGSYDGIIGFGSTTIVHVDPDLSGYAEQAVLDPAGACYGYCTGQGNNPALLKASVASSGYVSVAGYPNTYQGFNWALLHLRDLYAPNVLLSFHISNWATGTDIGSDHSTTLDVVALGQQAGSFAAQSGIIGVPAGTSSYDLLFNDPLDRDAGYYQYVYGNPNVWWDRLNVTFPNFTRWEGYVYAASQATGKSVFVWQIPMGNQYFATDNNSTGHYQDNRVEYFFSHLPELQQAGIIGLLFGAGAGAQSTYADDQHDGVTNPASFCTNNGLSSGQICNNHTSSYADDDGGLLRLQAQQYYAALGAVSVTPTPITISTATPAATATVATTATPAATATVATTATPTTIATSTQTSTATPSNTATATPTTVATSTQTSTATPSNTATATPTTVATSTRTSTATPSSTAMGKRKRFSTRLMPQVW